MLDRRVVKCKCKSHQTAPGLLDINDVNIIVEYKFHLLWAHGSKFQRLQKFLNVLIVSPLVLLLSHFQKELFGPGDKGGTCIHEEKSCKKYTFKKNFTNNMKCSSLKVDHSWLKLEIRVWLLIAKATRVPLHSQPNHKPIKIQYKRNFNMIDGRRVKHHFEL